MIDPLDRERAAAAAGGRAVVRELLPYLLACLALTGVLLWID